MNMDKTDEQLIREICRRQDRAAADELVRRYYRPIYAFLYRKCGNESDAMDLTQDVFIAALRSLKMHRPELASFKTWLYHIAFNRFIDHTRRISFLPLPSEDPGLQAEYDLLRQIADRDLLDRIDSYVSQYDAAAQEIWFLHLHQDIPFREIAGLLHMKEESVKSKYYRLLKLVRKEFEYEYRERI